MSKLGKIMNMRSRNPGTLTVLRSAAMAMLVTSALAGCEQDPFVSYQKPVVSVDQRYPITLADRPVIMEIPVSPATVGLTGNQRAEVASFVRAYRNDAAGSLVIRTPSGTRNEAAALSTVEDIRSILAENDIPAGAVRYRPYSGREAGTPYPPVVIGYKGVTAVSAECGDWSENLTANYENKPYPDFGCASQKNLAAMVSNPRDLETPRGWDAAPAERRSVVREKYIKGQDTAAKSALDDKGNVSQVAR